MYTEDEAKTKWCPFVRTVEIDLQKQVTRARNRVWNEDGDEVFSNALVGCQCIASECMAWRWCEEFIPHESGISWKGKTVQSDQGYCGLAGEQK